jgi:hypothetical protein
MEDGYRLGRWVLGQRIAFRKGRLSAERAARLDALPGWTWNRVDAAWEDQYSCLERFVADHGHARVPNGHRQEGYGLGVWVGEQRAAFRAGRLSAERAARLEALPGWNWDPLDASWEEGFSCLERFVTREGAARVPASHVEDGYRLGTWVNNQRQSYRTGKLSAERTARLEALPGWDWNPVDASWEEGFSCLERFVGREGHARVPQRHVEDGYRLGTWVNNQRQSYRTRRLSDERSARLEALPGWDWNPLDASWEEGYSSLERFVAREGTAIVPVTHVEEGYALGQWVGNQRRAFRDGRLSAERTARLQALPGWDWNPLDASWEEGFSCLERFVDREGHARVPQRHSEDGYRLGAWVSSQRTASREGRLSAERRARLEALQGWKWDALGSSWEEGYSSLERFVDREGHARVPRSRVEDGYPLGEWVHSQRRAYGAGRLDAERAARLTSLPGWTWNPPMGRTPREHGAIGRLRHF